MLTDIFADRYQGVRLWDSVEAKDQRFLVQGYRIISEQLFPYWNNGKESAWAKSHWTSVHNKLSMELGVHELAPKGYHFQSTYNGKPVQQSGTWTIDKVCQDFLCSNYSGEISADLHLKNRISFIELAFRSREDEIANANKKLPLAIYKAALKDKKVDHGKFAIPGNRADALKAMNETLKLGFRNSVNELNERMRRVRYNLNYHNGFIQISDDERLEEQVEREFWAITADPLWQNVDLDLKEAIDLRDSGGRDPSFYAARALESAIKIISDQKGWTHGKENGAHNYIDNLGSSKNGNFIDAWERDALKAFFTSVRNPFGHGPGSQEMPKLSIQQTNWAIEACMTWVKSLVKRM